MKRIQTPALNYEQSIRSIMLYEAAYYKACERADNDDEIEPELTAFIDAKERHAEKYGRPMKRAGVWY